MEVLVIDDDNFSQKMVIRALQSSYTLHTASNGREGLELASAKKPACIILDVEMPGMNGYEVCEALKSNHQTEDIPVVFLSSHTDMRERMLGFEVGADDYMVKPFEAEALLAKVNIIIKYREEKKILQQQYSEAQKTAYMAMTGSSELGMAMQFVERSYEINDVSELSMMFLGLVSQLHLKCSLMCTTTNDEKHWFSVTGSVSPLEQELLSMVDKNKRFYDFGCRTIINYPYISILIKNMPIEDMERYGRIKDLLPAMLGSFNAKIFSINTQKAIQKQSYDLGFAFEKIRTALTGLGSQLRENQLKATKIMQSMLHEMNEALPRMALEEDQEEYILNSVEGAIVKSFALTDATEETSATFSSVLNEMDQLSAKQNTLIDDMMKNAPKNTDDGDDNYIMEVELF